MEASVMFTLVQTWQKAFSLCMQKNAVCNYVWTAYPPWHSKALKEHSLISKRALKNTSL